MADIANAIGCVKTVGRYIAIAIAKSPNSGLRLELSTARVSLAELLSAQAGGRSGVRGL